jgi:hypothetical protein
MLNSVMLLKLPATCTTPAETAAAAAAVSWQPYRGARARPQERQYRRVTG